MDIQNPLQDAAGFSSWPWMASVGKEDNMTRKVMVAINSVNLDSRFQMRAELNQGVIDEYTELIRDNGGKWPFDAAVQCVEVSGKVYVVDGWHRVKAALAAGEDQILVQTTKGTERDALRAALRANSAHGLRRSNADKRRAVRAALADADIREMSHRQVADLCGVSHNFVATIAGAMSFDDSSPRKTAGADGADRPATMQAAETQRADIRGELNADSSRSDREIAGQLSCDHKTVAKVRRALQESEEFERAADDMPAEPELLRQKLPRIQSEVRRLFAGIAAEMRAACFIDTFSQLKDEDIAAWK